MITSVACFCGQQYPWDESGIKAYSAHCSGEGSAAHEAAQSSWAFLRDAPAFIDILALPLTPLSFKQIYLDNNASTPLAPEVIAAFKESFESFANPIAGHNDGKFAHRYITACRESLGAVLDVSPSDIFFTSGCTESDNIGIIGPIRTLATQHLSGKKPAMDRPVRWPTCECAACSTCTAPPNIISSDAEHPAVLESLAALTRSPLEGGYSCTLTLLDTKLYGGRVTPEAVAAALQPNTVLISLQHANSETGVANDLTAIVRAVDQRWRSISTTVTRPLFHADCAASIGKLPLEPAAIGLDYVAIAPHKFHGPKGIGAIWINPKAVVPAALTYGSGQEGGRRPGTQNVHAIAALDAAARLIGPSLLPAHRGQYASVAGRLFHLISKGLCGIAAVQLNGSAAGSNGNVEVSSAAAIDVLSQGDRIANTLSLSFRAVNDDAHRWTVAQALEWYRPSTMALAIRDSLPAVEESQRKRPRLCPSETTPFRTFSVEDWIKDTLSCDLTVTVGEPPNEYISGAAMMALLKGRVSMSVGSACHGSTPSPAIVGAANGLVDRARGTLRITVGRYTTLDEVESAAYVIVRAARILLRRN